MAGKEPRAVALVTGASSGLGLEIAVGLAERGFRVCATMRDLSRRARLDAEARTRGVELHVLPLDVTDSRSIDRAVADVLAAHGTIDALVNNAGIVLRGYFEDLADAEIRQVFETNLFGTMAVTRAVLPHMRAAGGGRLLIVSSVGGRLGAAAVSGYCASKFALEGFGEALAQEVEPFGVRVSLLEPAMIATDVWDRNRGVARAATRPDSPYAAWFEAEERWADQLTRSSGATARDVAEVAWRVLTAKRPRLRYVIGSRAARLLAFRRLIPGELFERAYFSIALRRIVGRASS